MCETSPAVGASRCAGSPLPSHPTLTSQKEHIWPTPSESYGLLFQRVTASRAPDKGTDGLEIRRVTVTGTASGPRGNVHSKRIYFSTRRSQLGEQDLPGTLRRRSQDLDVIICGDTTDQSLRFLPRNFEQLKKRPKTQRPSSWPFPDNRRK